jgi:hypothetical protein
MNVMEINLQVGLEASKMMRNTRNGCNADSSHAKSLGPSSVQGQEEGKIPRKSGEKSSQSGDFKPIRNPLCTLSNWQ